MAGRQVGQAIQALSRKVLPRPEAMAYGLNPSLNPGLMPAYKPWRD